MKAFITKISLYISISYGKNESQVPPEGLQTLFSVGNMERSQSQDTDGGGAIGEDSSAPLNEEYPSKDKASSIHSDKPKNRRRKRSNKVCC